MTSNPFTSKPFKDIFIEHFIANRSIHSFDFISGVEFYKVSNIPLFLNIGDNLTKGITYYIQSPKQNYPQKNNTFFIHDVPDYTILEEGFLPNSFKILKVRQYPGYYIDLSSFPTIDAYLKESFSKPTRYKLRKYRRRLENNFDITYRIYQGSIERGVYTELFKIFYSLLTKRYSEKKIRNNNLDSREWAFYNDVAFEMIQNGQAKLFVIYDADVPISITLNYIKGTTLISALTAFDLDYGIFHVGSVAIWKQLEWCKDNGMTTFDFSKGHFKYKSQWANHKYQFEHHILYSKKSIVSSMIAHILYTYQRLKQYLRRKNLNKIYNKVRFRLRHINTTLHSRYQYTTHQIEEIPTNKALQKINRLDPDHLILKKPLNSFIYLNQEHCSAIELFFNPNQNEYYIRGENAIEHIRILS